MVSSRLLPAFRPRTRAECVASLGLSMTFLPRVGQPSVLAPSLTIPPVLTLWLIRGNKCSGSSEQGGPLRLPQFSEPMLGDLVLNIRLEPGDFLLVRSLQPCEVLSMAGSQSCPWEGRGTAHFSHAPWVSAPRLCDASWTSHVLGQGWARRGAECGHPPLQAQHRDVKHPRIHSYMQSPNIS